MLILTLVCSVTIFFGFLGIYKSIKDLGKNKPPRRYTKRKNNYICKKYSMQKININTLQSLLTLGTVSFSYKKMDGSVKVTRGTNLPAQIPIYSRPTSSTAGGFTTGGNLSYYDLEDDQWKSVWVGAEIFAKVVKMTQPATVTTSVTTNAIPVLFNAYPGQLDELLSKKIVRFEYQTTDGDARQAYGTNDATRVGNIGGLTARILSYYDIEKEDIRSLSLAANATVKILDIIDLPLKK